MYRNVIAASWTRCVQFLLCPSTQTIPWMTQDWTALLQPPPLGPDLSAQGNDVAPRIPAVQDHGRRRRQRWVRMKGPGPPWWIHEERVRTFYPSCWGRAQRLMAEKTLQILEEKVKKKQRSLKYLGPILGNKMKVLVRWKFLDLGPASWVQF